jgi:hypothetical protein
MLEKLDKDRNKIKEWMNEDDKKEINQMADNVTKKESEIKELNSQKEFKGINGSDKISSDNPIQEQERRFILKKLQKELIEFKRKSRGDISWLKKLDILEFDKEKLSELCDIIERCGENLSFLVYSQYKFRKLHMLHNKYYENVEEKSRGRYDVDVNLECANVLLFVTQVNYLHLLYRSTMKS